MNQAREAFHGIVGGETKELIEGVEQAVKIKNKLDAYAAPLGVSGNAALIAAAVLGTGVALAEGYSVIHAHIEGTRKAVDQFDEDHRTKTVSLFIPDERKALNDRTKAIKTFIDALKGGEAQPSLLYRYAGIHFAAKTHPKHGQGSFYSILSFFAMKLGAGFSHASSEDKKLDEARRRADLFLSSRVPMILDKVCEYKKDNPVTVKAFPNQTIEGLNTARFVMIALANILLNLQYLSDLDSDISAVLDDQDAVNMCARVEKLIDDMLCRDGDFAAILELDKDFDIGMKQFLERFRDKTYDLKMGYQSKLIHHLNVSEVISDAHALLRSIDHSLSKMLYLKQPYTRSIDFVAVINEVARCLTENPTALASFPKQHHKIGERANPSPTTVLDVIALYVNCSKDEQSRMKKSMQLPDLFNALKDLQRRFIKPLLELEQGNASSSSSILSFSPSPLKRASVNGSTTRDFLFPWIALTIRSYVTSLPEIETANGSVFTGRQQILDITHQESQAVSWGVLDRMGWKPETLVKLKTMLQAQYALLGALGILDALRECFEDNKFLLLFPANKERLKRALLTVQQRHDDLMIKVQELSDYIDKYDKTSDESRRRYLVHMQSEETGLQHRTSALNLSISQALKVISSASFSQNERLSIDEKTDGLAAEAVTMYGSHAEFVEQDLPQIKAMIRASVQGSDIPTAAGGRSSSAVGVMVDSATSTEAEHVEPESSQQQDRASVPNPMTHTPDHAFRFQAFCSILSVVSGMLLIAGLMLVVSMTYGASYLPIVAAMSANNVANITLGGFMSAAAGGFGLALSYCSSSSFFRQNAPSSRGGHVLDVDNSARASVARNT